MPMDLRRPERTFTIRQLCLEFKCTPRALRFYEDKGLLAPARDGPEPGLFLQDRARLQLILRGKRVGLALAEIREILDLYDMDDGGAPQTAKSLRKFRERIVALEQQREDVDNAIDELREALRAAWRRSWPRRGRTCCRAPPTTSRCLAAARRRANCEAVSARPRADWRRR